MRSGVLIAVAAPAEARAACRAAGLSLDPPPWTLVPLWPGADLVVTGVGKANAAGGVARVADPARHGLVLSLGIAGALPRSGGAMLALGSLVVATESAYADEGLESPAGWATVAELGFPLAPAPMRANAVPGDAGAVVRLAAWADASGPIATVSTCSGTDALAAKVAARTSALAEAMEGAAIGQAACRLGLAFAEARAISNTTGDRASQRWDIRAALERLERVVGGLREGWGGSEPAAHPG